MKKIIAVLLAMTLVPISSVFAEQADKGDKVTLIVELSGDALLETEQGAEMGIKLFSETDEAQELESRIRSEQAQVIPNTGYDTIKVFVWNSIGEMVPLYDVFEF